MLALSEIVTGMADPTTYRELQLLGKMLADIAADEEAPDLPTVSETTLDAEARLRARGIDPARAGDLVRALQALHQLTVADGRPDPDPA